VGPLGAPEALQQLGPVWDRAKRPLVLLFFLLLAFVALLAWLDLR
jgi:hypothetical protein